MNRTYFQDDVHDILAMLGKADCIGAFKWSDAPPKLVCMLGDWVDEDSPEGKLLDEAEKWPNRWVDR